MLTDVRLYGHLGERFGREHQFYLTSVGEVVAALDANFPGFRAHLIAHSEPGYRVLVNDEPRTAEELALLVAVPSTIKIVPVVQGAGDGKSIGMTILGAVLAIVGVFTGGYLIGVGVALMLGGVSQLLAPQPTRAEVAPREAERKRRQLAFSGTNPTIEQGVPVPIRYGEQIIQGYPISVRLVTEFDAG